LYRKPLKQATPINGLQDRFTDLATTAWEGIFALFSADSLWNTPCIASRISANQHKNQEKFTCSNTPKLQKHPRIIQKHYILAIIFSNYAKNARIFFQK
jgi:hypothetical protein